MKGRIFEIQRFSIHDGPGIRTTVFLKGCPLNCRWCHNPEGISPKPELSFLPKKCIGCGYCLRVCRRHAHQIVDDQHVLDREICEVCGACTKECYAGALELVGRDVTEVAVLDEVIRDKPFYETSGGGMTLSGGEPMAQFDFALALCRAAKGEGIHICMETSGYGPEKRFLELRPHVDLFLYDYKETDPELHMEFTGVEADGILRNLRALDEAGAAIVLRCPVVPGFNDRDDHLAGIARTANGLRNVREIQIEPYHPLGRAKSERLALPSTLPNLSFPDDAIVASWVAKVQTATKLTVRRL